LNKLNLNNNQTNKTMATIRIKKSELADPDNARKFLQIVGRDRYQDALAAISFQHFGGGKLDRLAANLSNISDANYPAYQKKLEEEMRKLRPLKEDVSIEFEILPSDLEFHKQALFLEVFDEQRFFEAQGLSGMEAAHEGALQAANPYLRRKREQELAEAARQAAEAERKRAAEKNALKEAGIEVGDE